MKVRRLAVVVASIALVLASTFAAKAQVQVFTDQAVNLADLLAPNGSLTVGDKTFSDFSYIAHAGGSTLAADITVTPILDEFGYGIRLSGETLTAIGDQVNGFVLQFDVAVVPESNQLISDVHLRYESTNIGDGFSEVVETAIDPSTDDVLGQAHVHNPPTQLDSGFDLSTPLSKITIVKDVRITGDTGNRRLSENSASIISIDQSFSQIPEPSAILLVGAGLFGAALTMRRRR